MRIVASCYSPAVITLDYMFTKGKGESVLELDTLRWGLLYDTCNKSLDRALRSAEDLRGNLEMWGNVISHNLG